MTDAPVTPAAAPATYPGKTLGIVGLVLAILAPIVGFIISLVARSQSKTAGFKNTPAKAGIIIGLILTVLYIVLVVAGIALGAAAINSVCDGQAPGVYQTTTGSTVTCP